MIVFFQFIISVRVGMCDYAPGATKYLVTPLNITLKTHLSNVLFAILNTNFIFVHEAIILKRILNKNYEDVEWADLEHNSVKSLQPNKVQNLGFLRN